MLIITGTDTGVGKTLVTASLARALKMRATPPAVRKPFASGVTPGCTFHDDDALLLKAAAGSPESLEAIRPATYSAPLAPLSAGRLEHKAADIEALASQLKAWAAGLPICLVEGVGGAAVPVAQGKLFSDFARLLGAPALVVARTALGTVNHTLLTVEHLRAREIPVLGVVFVRHQAGPLSLAEETGPDLAIEFTGVRNFGVVPWCEAFAAAGSLEEAVDALPHHCAAIQQIADLLAGTVSA